MCSRLLCFLTLISSISVFASEAQFLAFKPEIQRGDIYQPQGLWPLLGVGLGTMSGSTNTRTGGVPGHIKVLGTYYFEGAPIVADAGLGLHNEFLTQNGPGSDTIQSLYTEFAGRYMLTNRWQLGAIWNTLVDNPHRYQSNNDNLATFIGAQALKEFAWSDEYLVRIGGRAMTSLGLNGGSVSSVMAELEVSFGPGSKSSSVVVAPTPAILQGEPLAPHLDQHAMQTFSLDPKTVHFASNSTALVKPSQTYIKRLAHALAENHQLFERVNVIGHADQRGSKSYNNKISERRALEVSRKLLAAGVNAAQITVEGKGKNELLSHAMTPSALLLNRRVQLEFQGVKNQAALKNVLASVAR